MHIWIFYSLSALYFLLSLVFFSCSFAPFPPRMAAKESFPQPLQTCVCMSVCVCTEVLNKRQIETHASLVCAPTLCAHTRVHVQYRPHYTDWPQGFVPELFPVWGSRERVSSDDEIWRNDRGGLPVYSARVWVLPRVYFPWSLLWTCVQLPSVK